VNKTQLDAYRKIVTNELQARNLNLTGSAVLGGNLIVTGSISGSDYQGMEMEAVTTLSVSGSTALSGSVYLTGSTPNVVASQSGQVIQFSLSQNPNVTSLTAANITGSTRVSGSDFRGPSATITNLSGSEMSLSGNLYVDGSISGSINTDNITALNITGSNVLSGSSIYGASAKITSLTGSEISLDGNLYVNGDISGSMITDNITALNVTGSNNLSGSNILGPNANITNMTGSELSLSGNLNVDGSTSVKEINCSSLVSTGSISGSNLYAYHNEFGAYIVVIDGVEFTLGYS
jgi:cytoskeletal protein CcmA (bactofilin family)